MIAVDTNILVYAHRRDSTWHAPAERAVRGLAEGSASWALPWPCIHEFLAVVTHPRIYQPATPLEAALDQVDAWLESPSLTLLAETDRFWPSTRETIAEGRVTGGRVHDARVAALCLHHGVRRLFTADRDFSRFPRLKTTNPLVG